MGLPVEVEAVESIGPGELDGDEGFLRTRLTRHGRKIGRVGVSSTNGEKGFYIRVLLLDCLGDGGEEGCIELVGLRVEIYKGTKEVTEES